MSLMLHRIGLLRPSIGSPAASAPDAFAAENWSITPGDEEADVTIHTLPANGGAAITDVEYRLDGGAWASSGGTSSFTISGLANDQEYDVELRAVNDIGASAASDTKPVTPESEGEEWTPADLPGLALWLEAQDLSTLFQSNTGATSVASDGDPVGHWGDKSGNGFHFTSVGNGTDRPTYHTSDGLHWVESDGSNDWLRRSTSIGLYNSGACSVFFAMRGDPTAGRTLFGDRGTGLYQFMSAGGDADDQSLIIRNDTSANLLALGAAIADEVLDGTDRVIGFTDSGSTVVAYADGAQVDSDNYTRSGTMTATTTSLFANSTGSENFAACVYGLIVVLGRVVDATERANITTYLAALQGRSL